MEVDDLTGQKPISPHTLQPEATHTVNYRSEPMRNRLRLIQEAVVCPDCEGEEVHHDSWVFGDPDTPILRAYVGDPIKIRLVHAGTQETHAFHYHVHQWLFEPTDQDSELLDAQAISPQTHYTVTPLYGGGSLQGAIGDAVIHCHLYPHFGEGMWGCNVTLILYKMAVNVILMEFPLKLFNRYQIYHYHPSRLQKGQGFQTLYQGLSDVKHLVHLLGLREETSY